ncbi:co-regulatory protein PtrA N-terminal domain-containing protein [Pseudomonas putida]|jgi:hypothetical protein|nr:co-regulatory protein PtrA N-terminal domain-containing protein [Pseudomonas putida]WJN66674.1 hypothetical protein [Pseudomonas putida]
MKYLRLLLIVGATLLSSTVWAESGSDRSIERIAAMGSFAGGGGILR